MDDNNTWVKTRFIDARKELDDFKSLLEYFNNISEQFEKKYFIPDLFVRMPFSSEMVKLMENANVSPELIDMMNSSFLGIGEDAYDLRMEYTMFMRDTVSNLVYIYARMIDTPNYGDLGWFQFHFGTFCKGDERDLYKIHSHTTDNLTRDWLYRTMMIWEFGLRGLVKYVTEQEEIKQVSREREILDKNLNHTDPIPIIWRSFIQGYLEENDSELDSLHSLSMEIRNTIHNYSLYYPNSKDATDHTIEYKGERYEFQIGRALNFFHPHTIPMIVKDNFDLMVRLFENEKVKKHDNIPGYFKKSWYGQI